MRHIKSPEQELSKIDRLKELADRYTGVLIAGSCFVTMAGLTAVTEIANSNSRDKKVVKLREAISDDGFTVIDRGTFVGRGGMYVTDIETPSGCVLNNVLVYYSHGAGDTLTADEYTSNDASTHFIDLANLMEISQGNPCGEAARITTP